jgi:hypothetical protein
VVAGQIPRSVHGYQTEIARLVVIANVLVRLALEEGAARLRRQ